MWLLMELFLRGVSSGFEIQDSVHVNGYDLSIVNCQLSIVYCRFERLFERLGFVNSNGHDFRKKQNWYMASCTLEWSQVSVKQDAIGIMSSVSVGRMV